MRDQLYKMMKQVGDPTAFTKMLNEVQSQIDAEEAAKEQKNADLDDARAALCEAVVCYCEALFDIEEDLPGQHEEMVDKFYVSLEEVEDDLVAYMNFMDGLKNLAEARKTARAKRNACSHNEDCDCEKISFPEPEKVIDTPEAHIEVRKIPVKKDVDVDTIIGEFLKSLH